MSLMDCKKYIYGPDGKLKLLDLIQERRYKEKRKVEEGDYFRLRDGVRKEKLYWYQK
jgi:hypothetical protein